MNSPVAIMARSIHAVPMPPVRAVPDVVTPIWSIIAVAVARIVGRGVTVRISLAVARITIAVAVGSIIAAIVVRAGYRGADQGAGGERSPSPAAAVPATPTYLNSGAVVLDV